MRLSDNERNRRAQSPIEAPPSASIDPPAGVRTYLGPSAPRAIAALGNLDILHRPKLALFCSIKCPGRLILRTYDLAQALRDAGEVVIGGFHSPMERECLALSRI